MIWLKFFYLTTFLCIDINHQVRGALVPNCDVTVKEIKEELDASVVALYEVKPLNGSFSPRQFERYEIFVLRRIDKNCTEELMFSLLFRHNSSFAAVGMHKAPVMGNWIQLSFRLNEEFKEVLKQFSHACESELERLTALLVLNKGESKIPCRYLHDNESEFCFPTSYKGFFKLVFKTVVLLSNNRIDDEIVNLIDNTCYQTLVLHGLFIFSVCLVFLFVAVNTPGVSYCFRKLSNLIRSKKISPF